MDLREHLPEIITATLRNPIPIPVRKVHPESDYCRVDKVRTRVPTIEIKEGDLTAEQDYCETAFLSPITWAIFPTKKLVGKRVENQLKFIERVLNSVQKPPQADPYNGDYDILGEFQEMRVWTFFEYLETEIFFQFISQDNLQEAFEKVDENENLDTVEFQINSLNWRPMPGKFEGSEWDAPARGGY